jgi:SNF2-related domain/Helicase conserved C-terminal domain
MIGKLFGTRDQKKDSRQDSARVLISVEADGVRVSLQRAGQPLPFAAWQFEAEKAFSAASRLLDAPSTEPDPKPATRLEGAQLIVPHQIVQDMGMADANALGLPPFTNMALQLTPQNRIDQDTFAISTEWVRPSGQVARVRVVGAFIEHGGEWRRIPGAALSLLNAARELHQPLPKRERFEALARLSAAWPENAERWLQNDGYLGAIRVHYASRMSLSLNQLTADATDFDPILFGGARPVDDENTTPLDEVSDSILTPAAQKLFAKDRFRREPSGRDVYLLKDGAFVFIDPALRPALDVVRKMQDRPAGEKRQFILNPRPVLRQILGDELADKLDLETLFVETEQFSERVSGVDVWRKAVLPWLTPSQSNKWIPERFGLRVGEVYFSVAPESALELLARADQAESSASPWVNVQGLMEPSGPDYDYSPPVELPATPQTLDAIRALGSIVRPLSSSTDQDESEVQERLAPAFQKIFLVVQENFEEVEFSAPAEPGSEVPLISVSKPSNLKTELKPHQQDGLNWLCQCHAAERPGALLADDMGLGKTMQALAFMAWLRDRFSSKGALPRILIVAPTALLGNWLAEINTHLHADGLGPILTAYGTNLRQLREIGESPARDIETGRAALQLQEWDSHRVILTTYETLRDYHFSFARIPFDLVVFDEVQKLKNPTSQMTRAAKTLKVDFTLALTGTPVENRLQDLWSIFDIVAPGLLGSSRDFERKHPTSDRVALGRLKSRLVDAVGGAGPYMLRRMKSDALKGLPLKHIHRIQMTMPPLQAQCYEDLVARAMGSIVQTGGVAGNILTTLALMRGCSLHPIAPSEATGDLDLYASDSARLSATLTTLNEISAKDEKVLIFLEDLQMQDHLATLVKDRFKLRTRPATINGSVPGARRQFLVEQFQAAAKGFDVMILSPKAGGVGLTLTAANHVIHLSRWWNPAVEDQATDRVYRIGQTKPVHVYLPMAVHPNPALSESSFDLRLDALMERKRALTRDLFMPPEPSDADLANLLREITQADLPESETDSVSAPAVQADAALPIEADWPNFKTVPERASPRPILSARNAGPLPKIWRVKAYAQRPLDDILSLFAGRTILQVKIVDPYALIDQESRSAQASFLGALAKVASTIERIVIQYNDANHHSVDDRLERIDMNERISLAFNRKPPPVDLRRPDRSMRRADFHDRSVELDILHAGGAVRQHVLHSGRGLLCLFEERFECTMTYAPPTG